MTEEEAKALGRRAVACKGFRPMRGMRDFDGRTWTGDLLWRWTDGVDFPDMRDPATLGCLLALVREGFASEKRLWGGRVEVHQDAHNIFVVVCPDHDSNGFLLHRWIASADVEAEALVAALEAASCST
jgi:hypothetical protein